MRTILHILFCASLIAACGPSGMVSGNQETAGIDDVVCVGDPDLGGVVCKPLSDFWDCVTMPNGDIKCTRPGTVTPSGSASWDCVHDGTKVICTTTDEEPGAGGPTGGSGDWACVSESGTTTCTSTTGADVPGAGDWVCTVDQEFGITCEGTPDDSAEGDSSPSGAGDTTGETGDDSSETSSETSGDDSTSETSGDDSTSETSGDDKADESNPDAFPCSYAMVVFEYGGKIYVVKIPKGWTTCTFTNQTSSDAIFEYTCNGDTYNNPGFVFSRNGAPVDPFAGPATCEELLTVKAGEVFAKPGVNIIYAAAHNGSFDGHFASLCPPPEGTDHLTFPDSC